MFAKEKGHTMDIENLDISPELREKAKACTSPEELLALAKKEGIKLSDADMEALSGGKKACGDVRGDIDPQAMSADFIEGRVRA